MAAKTWISKAIKHPGAFTAKAKRAHTTVSGLIGKVARNPSMYST